MCYSSQSFVCHVIVERLSIYVLDKLSTVIKTIAQRDSMTNKQQGSRYKPKMSECGDIYFFYRPKVRSHEVKNIDDVRRFYDYCA
jgi:hypothetical protein